MCTKPPDFGGQVGCPPLPGLAPGARKDDACLTRLPAAGRIHPNRTLAGIAGATFASRSGTGSYKRRVLVPTSFVGHQRPTWVTRIPRRGDAPIRRELRWSRAVVDTVAGGAGNSVLAGLLEAAVGSRVSPGNTFIRQ
jgi:hypothetical protein